MVVVEHFEVTPARLKSVGGGFYLVKIWGKSILVESGPIRLCVIFNYNFLCPYNIKKNTTSSSFFFFFIYLFIYFFFFYLKIEIYITYTHTLIGKGRGDSNLCQMGGRNSLAPLGQMPSGHSTSSFR